MTRRLPIVLAAAFLALAGSAHALTLQGAPYTHPWQQWSNESQMPMANIPVTFSEFAGYGPCGGDPGCTNWSQSTSDTGTVTNSAYAVAITRQADPPTLRHYLWHEATHVFDGAVMTDPFRAQFMAAWGLPGGPAAWLDKASEWFAEAGALCDRYGLNIASAGLPRLNDWTVYGFPGWQRMGALTRSCEIIAAAGRAAGLPVPAQRSYPAIRIAHARAQRDHGTVRGEG